MRSYNEYCAVAKALDVVGDRWTLLIVRELLLRDRCRYTDLRAGLPGIATNLLADRLRELEAAGVIEREQAPPPIATTLFALTDRGRQLEPILHELGRWGVPYMAAGPGPGDEFRSHWIVWPVETFLRDGAPDDPPVTIALDIDGDAMALEVGGGQVSLRPGRVERPDARLSGPPFAILSVLIGGVAPGDADALGLRHEGELGVLGRLVPSA